MPWVVEMPHSRGNAPLEQHQTEALRADLLRYFLRQARDPVLAEDLTQETLVHILGGLPAWRGTAGLRTWARQIALNVWRDHLRRRAASPVDRAAAGDVFSVAALLDASAPTAPLSAPEDLADRHATHNCLLAAARQLPLAERRIILLHDFGDMSIEQAAAACNCSLGAAKVRLHRARRRVAEICRSDCESTAGAGDAILCSPKRATTPATTGARTGRSARRRRP